MYLLRVLQDKDIELVKAWLQQDYVSVWFGDVEDWMLELKGRDNEYNLIHHFIVEDNPKAVRIFADPIIEEARTNEASIKVLEANGFEFDIVSGLYVKNI